MSVKALTRSEAEQRAELIAVDGYEIDLDLTHGDATFEALTTVRFRCRRPGAATFLQVQAEQVHEVSLNGVALDPSDVVDGRLPLSGLQSENRVVCRATTAFTRDGLGLVRSVDPADGMAYVYADCEVAGAPRVFACFDQPDLKAPVTVHVTVPTDWTVLGNGRAEQVGDGRWDLATTPPLATYFVTVCAGPFVSRHAAHDGIPLGLHARASLVDELDRWALELFDLTGRLLDYFHGFFGMR